MNLGLLYTRPLEDHDNGGEVGTFEYPVTIEDKIFLASRDKPGLVKKQISMFLAVAVKETAVPVEYWYCALESLVAKQCTLPSVLNFGAKL